MPNISTIFTAEASELQSSDLYMTVSMIMFKSDEPNLNGVRCTKAFIDEIINNQEKYVTLPLVVDEDVLDAGMYDKLSHRYNEQSDTFSTNIIGAFYKFEKRIANNGVAELIGYARISKRNKAACSAVAELFAQKKLKFSFEINVADYTELEDGTMQIDASEYNYLTALCIVSNPACVDAVAVKLVAECDNIVLSEEKEADDEMPEIINTEAEMTLVDSANAENINPEVAECPVETEKIKHESVETEDTVETKECIEPNNQVPEEDKPAEEDAQRKNKLQCECTPECNSECKDEKKEDCGECVAPEKELEEDAACKKKAEETEEDAACKKKVEETEEDAACKKKAEADNDVLFAELQKLASVISSLEAQIMELKAEKIKAEAETVIASANPFVETLTVNEHKYSLLEPVEVPTKYSLLEDA